MRRRIKAVEVLACAVITLFVGFVLWPVHSDGDPPSSTSVCRSNVKQLTLGMTLYSGDWDDRLPDVSSWMDKLAPYTHHPEFYHCPKVAGGAYGYGFSAKLAGADLGKIKDLETAPLLFDSDLLQRNAMGGLETLPNPARHRGQNFIAYADGSCRAYPPQPNGKQR
jgi:hypothetical protein